MAAQTFELTMKIREGCGSCLHYLDLAKTEGEAANYFTQGDLEVLRNRLLLAAQILTNKLEENAGTTN